MVDVFRTYPSGGIPIQSKALIIIANNIMFHLSYLLSKNLFYWWWKSNPIKRFNYHR